MKMEIKDIDYCIECGVLYNKEEVCKKIAKNDTGYHTHIYVGICPACGKEVDDER